MGFGSAANDGEPFNFERTDANLITANDNKLRSLLCSVHFALWVC